MHFKRHQLQFIKPAKTSKIEYLEKDILLIEQQFKGTSWQGEVAPLPHLSEESLEDCEYWLQEAINNNTLENLEEAPSSIRFALEGIEIEQKVKPLKIDRIKINGLVWMNDFGFMRSEVKQKVNEGFECIKVKVGQHDFDAECRFLEEIRNEFGSKIELRLDANGAFAVEDALEKLKELKRFHIHSIEQPVAAGQWDAMEMICRESAIDIALDEELIGVKANPQLLKKIKPQYLIFKPTLHGGFKNCDAWISLCRKMEIPWWATSALESNIGLYHIALWVSQYQPKLPQGLGTGSLFKENFERPIRRENQWLSIATP